MYIVFARKWRPQNFNDIVGQDNIVTRLKGAIQKNRLAHAYLFAGPRGVGKTSCARILAKALNCKDGPTINPCDSCSACREIREGRSLDVIEIDGASNRGIEQIRELRENVKFGASGGKSKIYIIDEVHMLTTEAFNALLKTLEEPPEHVKFIFATTHPDKVLPTILSRCQRFDFRPITVLEIIAKLEKIASSEKIKLDKDVFFAIARAAEGSIRDAESILDQLVSFSKDEIKLEDVISVLGLVQQEFLFDLTNKIIQKDSRGILEALNDFINQGKDLSHLLQNLIEHFRNLMVARISQDTLNNLLDFPDDIKDKIFKQAQDFSLDEILNSINLLAAAQDTAKRLGNFRFPLEMTLIKLGLTKVKKETGTGAKDVSPKQSKSAVVKDEVRFIERVNTAQDIQPQGNADTATVVAGAAATDTVISSRDISLDAVLNIWLDCMQRIARERMSVATFLQDAKLVAVKDGILTLGFSKAASFHMEALERRDNKGTIERILSDILDTSVKISFAVLEENSLNPQIPKDDSEPFIRSALETFRGRLIRGS